MGAAGTWTFIGLFLALPAIVAALLLALVDDPALLVIGLVLTFSWAGTGVILAPEFSAEA